MKYDIIIVGAGPAGAIFAANAPKEKKVLLIDGHTIKYKGKGKPCGGLISSDAQKELKKLGYEIPAEILTEPQIPFVKTIDTDAHITLDCARNYINVDRAEFDEWLRKTSAKNVQIALGVCTDVKRIGKEFCVSIQDENGYISEYVSEWIIGADGADSIVRRKLFPDRKLRKYTAIQQWFSAEKSEPFYSCIFDMAATDRCMWALFKNGKMIFGGAFPQSKCRERFEGAKASLSGYKEYGFGEPILTEACTVACPKWNDLFCGCDKALFVGEAAGFISASSFEGISYALYSGKLAADAFSSRGDPEKAYKRASALIKMKLRLKMVKASLMFKPFFRKTAMKLGIGK